MQITSGLLEHIVLQRSKRDLSDARIDGRCRASGTVKARVRCSGKVVKGLADRPVGRASGGRFEARLAGLPVGGPYDVELWIDSPAEGERVQVADVLVGDVWLLGGQSNMQGVGRLEGLPKASSQVRAFYMDDRWAHAEDPIHNMWLCVDQVHKDLCGGSVPKNPSWLGAGPGVSFGHHLHRLSGVPQGLIACGHGGTTMSQWDPALKGRGSRSLYGAMVRRLKKNGSRVAGMVWYQGCSDADCRLAGEYTRKMKRFIGAVRRDCGNARMPWIVVQIARVAGWGQVSAWNSIQEQQRRLGEAVDNVAVVPAIDMPLDDGIHLSGQGQWRLGGRLAHAAWTLQGGKDALPPPIKFKGVRIVKPGKSFCADVVLTYDNVVGSLRSSGEPQGFAVADSAGGRFVYRTDLKANQAILHVALETAGVPCKMLYYGQGIFPACNVTDEADRSLPVMGPISLGEKPAAMTDFIRHVQVSGVTPIAGAFRSVRCPDTRKLKLQRRLFSMQFLDLHHELAAMGPRNAVAYYVLHFHCSEPMRLAASLGYDGPLKVWVDRREILCDATKSTPAIPDARRAEFAAKAGEHELVLGICSNLGKAWGVFLRFQRLDVPTRLVMQGPEFYEMPQVVK